MRTPPITNPASLPAEDNPLAGEGEEVDGPPVSPPDSDFARRAEIIHAETLGSQVLDSL